MESCVQKVSESFLKTSNTPEMYETNRKLLKSLISKQIPGNQKPLINALEFWLHCKHIWALYNQSSVNNATLSSLAKVAWPAIKADGGEDCSLLTLLLQPLQFV